MDKIDYKKTEAHLYLPKKPAIVQVPEMRFFAVEGRGDPNTAPAYQEARGLLYGLSFTVKMSRMSGQTPPGYFEYVVPPLEGLWWTEDPNFAGRFTGDKSNFCWVSMIRQPEFVDEAVFDWAVEALLKKHPDYDPGKVRFLRWEEGLCAQALHVGPYDDEPATLEKLEDFIAREGYRLDLSETRRHHEIYLGDPRRTKPERLRTVLRLPVIK